MPFLDMNLLATYFSIPMADPRFPIEGRQSYNVFPKITCPTINTQSQDKDVSISYGMPIPQQFFRRNLYSSRLAPPFPHPTNL